MYPHPQAALLADPTNWYPYQQMMLYQVSPPGYVPTAAHYVGGGSPQLIPGAAVYHPYSVTPGTINYILHCSIFLYVGHVNMNV